MDSEDRISFNDFLITAPPKIKEIYKTEELDRKAPKYLATRDVDPSVVDAMLDLYQITKEPRYARAVKKIIDINPTHPAEQLILARYRAIVCDTSYDERVMEYFPPAEVRPTASSHKQRENGLLVEHWRILVLLGLAAAGKYSKT